VWLLFRVQNPPAHSTAAAAYVALLVVTFGWSVVNLLPVLPLDGGRLLEQALPGSAQDRLRMTAVVSVLVGAAVSYLSWRVGDPYTAVMFALLAAYGLFLAVTGIAPGSTHRHTVSCEIFRQVCVGEYEKAEALCRSARRCHPALRALIDAVRHEGSNGSARLLSLYERKPSDSMTRSCVILWRVHNGEWPAVLSMFQSGGANVGACTSAIIGAYAAGAFDEAAAIGEAILRTQPNALVAYNTACSWSLSGNQELALSALMRAVEYGWRDWKHIDADADFTGLRETGAFRAWRATHGSGVPEQRPGPAEIAASATSAVRTSERRS